MEIAVLSTDRTTLRTEVWTSFRLRPGDYAYDVPEDGQEKGQGSVSGVARWTQDRRTARGFAFVHRVAFDRDTQAVEDADWERGDDGAILISGGVVIETGTVVALPPPAPPEASAANVDAETVRRICSLWGAVDQVDALAKQANAQALASELLEVLATGGTLTADQEAQRIQIKALRAETKRLRAVGADIKATIAGLDAGPLAAFDITDAALWS